MGRLGPVKWTSGRPVRGPGPAGAGWSGPIALGPVWAKTCPRGLSWRWAKGGPCGGLPLVAALAGGGGGHEPRGDRLQCHCAMWPCVVGQRADEGSGRRPRGGRFYCYCDVGWRRQRARAARWAASVPLGDVATCGWPEGWHTRHARAARRGLYFYWWGSHVGWRRRRARAARRAALLLRLTWSVVVTQRADAGRGRENWCPILAAIGLVVRFDRLWGGNLSLYLI